MFVTAAEHAKDQNKTMVQILLACCDDGRISVSDKRRLLHLLQAIADELFAIPELPGGRVGPEELPEAMARIVSEDDRVSVLLLCQEVAQLFGIPAARVEGLAKFARLTPEGRAKLRRDRAALSA